MSRYDDYHDDDDLFADAEYDYEHLDFADPSGESALRAATRTNPRDQPCPTCGGEDLLTRKDVELGYQCDGCALRDERGW